MQVGTIGCTMVGSSVLLTKSLPSKVGEFYRRDSSDVVRLKRSRKCFGLRGDRSLHHRMGEIKLSIAFHLRNPPCKSPVEIQ